MTGLPRCAIIAMGVSGCGKSTLIAHLAAQLDCRAFEGDDFHAPESIAKMRAGEPLQDVDRWPWLDRLGSAVGAAVQSDGVAVAACSALKRSYRERLANAARVPLLFAFLDGERDDIAARFAGRVRHFMPLSLLDSQFGVLERPSEDEPALVLNCNAPVADLSLSVLSRLRSGALAASR